MTKKELIKNGAEKEAIKAYENIAGKGYLDVFEEAYQGRWDSDEEFVQELLEDTEEGIKDLPPYIHIDWEWTAREIMMDYSEDNHYYFWNF